MTRFFAAAACLAAVVALSGCACHKRHAKEWGQGPEKGASVSEASISIQEAPPRSPGVSGGPMGGPGAPGMDTPDGFMGKGHSAGVPGTWRERNPRDRVEARVCAASFLGGVLGAVMDENCDGKITPDELKKFDEMVMRAAPEGQGYVTLDELITGAGRMAEDRTLKALLKRFDKNNDGCISAEELGPDLARYASLDVDGDGAVSIKDFRIIGACVCQGMRPGSLQRQAMRQEGEKGPRDGERWGDKPWECPEPGVESTDGTTRPAEGTVGSTDSAMSDPPGDSHRVSTITVSGNEFSGRISSGGSSIEGEEGQHEARIERQFRNQERQQAYANLFNRDYFDPALEEGAGYGPNTVYVYPGFGTAYVYPGFTPGVPMYQVPAVPPGVAPQSPGYYYYYPGQPYSVPFGANAYGTGAFGGYPYGGAYGGTYPYYGGAPYNDGFDVQGFHNYP